MNQDKRKLYIWLFAILANVGTYIAIVIETINGGHFGVDAFIKSITTGESLALLGISLLISVVPIWLSGLNFRGRNYIGYGIPILVIIYSIWHYYTCNGKFCNLVDIPIIFSAIIFIVFFTLDIYLRRWSVKISIVLLCIEMVLLLGGITFAIYTSHTNAVSNAQLSLLQQESLKATTPDEIGKTCDSFPDSPNNSLRGECWQRAMTLYPNTDVCSWSKEPSSKTQCIFYQGLRYRENLEYGCEEKDSLTSYKKKDDPTENSRLLQCWAERAKIYPELNLCQYTYEWNQGKCNAFFKTTSR